MLIRDSSLSKSANGIIVVIAQLEGGKIRCRLVKTC